MHNQMQPYRNRRANLAESLLLFSLVLTSVFRGSSQGDTVQDYALALVVSLTCLFCLIMIFYLGFAFARTMWRRKDYVNVNTEKEEDFQSSFSSNGSSSPVTLRRQMSTPTNPITRSALVGIYKG